MGLFFGTGRGGKRGSNHPGISLLWCHPFVMLPFCQKKNLWKHNACSRPAIMIVSGKCFLILLLLMKAAAVTTRAEKWDNRQKQWMSADLIIRIIRAGLTLWWRLAVSVTVITLIVEHASRTGRISHWGARPVRVHCNCTPIHAVLGADDQSHVQVQPCCALAKTSPDFSD